MKRERGRKGRNVCLKTVREEEDGEYGRWWCSPILPSHTAGMATMQKWCLKFQSEGGDTRKSKSLLLFFSVLPKGQIVMCMQLSLFEMMCI